MAHICEALAERGYTVAAPEFPEILSASYRNENGVKRAEIVTAVLPIPRSRLHFQI